MDETEEKKFHWVDRKIILPIIENLPWKKKKKIRLIPNEEKNYVDFW